MPQSGPIDGKPKSIQTVGLLIAVLSTLIVLSNSMGALMFSMMDIGPIKPGNDVHPADVIWLYYIEVCLALVTFGVAYFVGGIFLRRHKLWANRLVTIASLLLVVGCWTLMAIMSSAMKHDSMVRGLAFFPYIIAFIFTIPLALLLRFLNRKHILSHFG